VRRLCLTATVPIRWGLSLTEIAPSSPRADCGRDGLCDVGVAACGQRTFSSYAMACAVTAMIGTWRPSRARESAEWPPSRQDRHLEVHEDAIRWIGHDDLEASWPLAASWISKSPILPGAT